MGYFELIPILGKTRYSFSKSCLKFSKCRHFAPIVSSITISGGGGLRGNCVTGVWPKFLKPTPIIYLVIEKIDPFIYTEKL